MTAPAATVRLTRPSASVRLIELDRPEKLNAMNAGLITDLLAALAEVREDNACRAVILTGVGRGFCSGMDLDDAGEVPNVQGLTVPRLAIRAMAHFGSVATAMRAVRAPVICAVNGPAYGGGMCLAVAGDMRIASRSAVFNATGIRTGLTSAELGVSWLLPRLIGASRSSELLFTGRDMSAEEALQAGLVSRVVAEEALLDNALEMAEQISAHSQHGVAMLKEVIWANLENPSLQAAIDLENRNQILLGMTTNVDEYKAARREGRAPKFRDLPMNWSQEWTDPE